MEITKICSNCEQEKIASSQNFSSDKSSSDGLQSWCKVCAKKYHKRYAKYKEKLGETLENFDGVKLDNLNGLSGNIEQIGCGYIYFLQEEQSKRIKIGYSNEPSTRKDSLQTGNSEKLILISTMVGKKDDESQIHKHFQRYRLNGEWFKPDSEILRFAKAFNGRLLNNNGSIYKIVDQHIQLSLTTGRPSNNQYTAPGDKLAGTFHETTDLEKFKLDPSNRDIDIRKVLNLMKSIEEKNLLFVQPILVNSDLVIIDGQHRYFAALMLKLSIYYTVGENLSRDDITRLQTVRSNWSKDDYLRSYIKQGYIDYWFFNEFKEKNKFLSFRQCLEVVAGIRGGGSLTSKFKQGKLVVTDEKLIRAQQIADNIKDYVDILKDHKADDKCKIPTTDLFVATVTKLTFHPEYDHEKCVKHCKRTPEKLYVTISPDATLMMFENMINTGRRKAESISLR